MDTISASYEITDDQLIDKFLNKNCEESFKQLVDRHSPLCFRISEKYFPSLQARGISPSQIVEDKHYIFYKSIISYDKRKHTRFSTWLANHVRYHCLNTINNTEPLLLMEEKDLILHSDNRVGGEDFSYFDYIMSVLDKMKDERVKQIFISRFLSGPKVRSWKLVAKDVGLSNQGCINLFIKAKRFLRAKLDKPELLEEF